MPKCPHCGRELQPGVRFCAGCGSVVRTNPDPQPVDPGTWQQPQEPPAFPTEQQWAPPPQEPPTQWVPSGQQEQQWAPAPQWDPPTQQEPPWAPTPQWAPQAQQAPEPPLSFPLIPPAYEPPPAKPPRAVSRGPVLVIASAALLVIAAVAGVIAYRHVTDTAGAPAARSTTVPAGPQVTAGNQPGSTTTGTFPTTTTAPPTTIDEASAQAALQQQATADHAAVEQLVGSWVPGLSAKQPGLVVNGVTFDYRAILADYRQQAANYPGALLLQSGDYSNFQLGGFWVTVAPQGFATAAEANAWCDSKQIGANDCFAERLMHTGGYQGNSVPRK